MKTIGLVTLVSAYAHLSAETNKPKNKGILLGDLQMLCLPEKKNHKHRGWSFKGDWKNSVQPFYN